MPKRSIKGTILFITVAVLLLQTLITGTMLHYIEGASVTLLLLIMSCSSMFAIAVLVALLNHFFKPIQQLIQALETGVSSFKDRDFSITIYKQRHDELGKIVDAYNEMSKTLREERMSLFQRELLLDTIIQSSPVSVVLTDQRNFVIYANSASKQLFKRKQSLEGQQFSELLAMLPNELKEATLSGKDGMVNMLINNERTSFYLHCQSFVLNSSVHNLYLYKNLSTEMSRQELELWKNAIRLISHELNNSLAPVSSLANSARKILSSGKHMDSLPEIIDTMDNRVKKLNGFLKEYARFARLPAPNLKLNYLPDVIRSILPVCPFNVTGETPKVSTLLDLAQIEQVLINIYKNALEAGSAVSAIELRFAQDENHVQLCIRDAGTGMSEQQLQQATLPFYTTKPGGTGLGLSLCNEVMIAHDGVLRVQNNNNPGLDITLVLPVRED